MPTFVVTAPDGKEYEVTAPEGATQEQVLAYVQANAGKPAAEPRSLGSEILRQVGLTARAGVTGVTALPALLAEPIAAGVNALAGRKVMESPTQAVQNLMTAAGVPAPETRLERAVQSGASAMAGTGAQAAAAKGVELLKPLTQDVGRQIATAAAAGTTAQPVAEKVMEETESPLLSTVAALATGAVAGTAAAKALKEGRPVPSASIEEIKKRAQEQYKTMENQGVFIKPQSTYSMISEATDSLKKANFNPQMDAHKPVQQVLDQMQRMVEDKRVSFSKLEQMRSAASDLRTYKDAATRKYGNMLVAEVDKFIASLNNKDLIASQGSLDKAVSSVQAARKDWRNLSRASILEDALDTAEAKALDPKASEGELLRRQLINLAANKEKMRFFTEREQNAIKSVAKGRSADPLLSLVARFNPERSQITMAGTALSAGVNPVGTAAVAGAGYGADKLLGALRQADTRQLIRDIASGNLPEQQSNLLFRSVLSVPPTTE